MESFIRIKEINVKFIKYYVVEVFLTLVLEFWVFESVDGDCVMEGVRLFSVKCWRGDILVVLFVKGESWVLGV